MNAHYKKLWKMLIDRDLSKVDLGKAANISGATLTKLTKGENVNVETLIRICVALECTLDDIVEIMPPDKSQGITSVKESKDDLADR